MDQEIEYSSQVKYLGLIFDSKLNWNTHLEKVITKATSSLFIGRRMVDNMWGLKPKIVIWIYTTIIWWERTNQKNVQRKLNKLQRLACLMI